MNKIKTIKFVCEACGSDNIVARIVGRWDLENQRWIVASEEPVDGYCYECEEECDLDKVIVL